MLDFFQAISQPFPPNVTNPDSYSYREHNHPRQRQTFEVLRTAFTLEGECHCPLVNKLFTPPAADGFEELHAGSETVGLALDEASTGEQFFALTVHDFEVVGESFVVALQ